MTLSELIKVLFEKGATPEIVQIVVKEIEDRETTITDPKTLLFNQGLKALAKASGRVPGNCRSLIGKWLKITKNDSQIVLDAIEEAVQKRVAEPVAWIEKKLGEKNSSLLWIQPETWIALDSAEWKAWSKYNGKPFPLDSRGGWTAPSRWPPNGH